ncbi:ABC transporter permease [Zavarzinia compransoris]|uniref:ABC transporter permease n=1 Tax=Zavarzinia compransoris TaxID=1264899 RepID=A0A317DY02_9PROT|nr:ABC transporter permease [Zavarzinia compransoris]PWR19598.1 ABC transporter permease [Zavarzinia compransoris]TDP40418.1 putative hydroxymethylpyrimidine transport system permease protein [Zavarzinia compransoris]
MTGLRAVAAGLATLAVLLLLWQAVILLAAPPPFILPSPLAVARALVEQRELLLRHGAVTGLEIAAGLGLGTMLGIGAAVVLSVSRGLRRIVLPLVIASQAVPVFAIAPLLVLWLGFGMASKIAMTCLIIFFPVTIALADGIARLDPGLTDMAQVMTGGSGRRGRRLRLLLRLYGPAALPALGSGLRIAAAVAPIGAVVGEWVGAAGGLGWLMLHANARAKIDLMFAALIVLAAIALLLYRLVDLSMRRLTPWAAGNAAPLEETTR